MEGGNPAEGGTWCCDPFAWYLVVMVGLVPTTHPTACSGVGGGLDPRNPRPSPRAGKPEDDGGNDLVLVHRATRVRPRLKRFPVRAADGCRQARGCQRFGLIPGIWGCATVRLASDMGWRLWSCCFRQEPGAELRKPLRAWPPDQRIAMRGARMPAEQGARRLCSTSGQQAQGARLLLSSQKPRAETAAGMRVFSEPSSQAVERLAGVGLFTPSESRAQGRCSARGRPPSPRAP